MSEVLYRLKPVVWREARRGVVEYLTGSVGRYVVDLWPMEDGTCVWQYQGPNGWTTGPRPCPSVDDAKAEAINHLLPKALEGFEPVTQ